MTRYVGENDQLDGFLRDLNIRLTRLERVRFAPSLTSETVMPPAYAGPRRDASNTQAQFSHTSMTGAIGYEVTATGQLLAVASLAESILFYRASNSPPTAYTLMGQMRPARFDYSPWSIGTHPTHAAACLWPYADDAVGNYVLLRSGLNTYLNALSGGSLYFRANNADYMRVDNQQLVFPAYGGGWFMQDTSWIRAVGNKNIWTPGIIGCTAGVSINLGGAIGGGYLFDMSGSMRIQGGNLLVGGGGTFSAQVQTNKIQPGAGAYYDAGFYCNPAASSAALSFHPGGTAPQFRTAGSDTNIYVRDAVGSTGYPLNASAFNLSSSRAGKRAIEAWFRRDQDDSAMGTIRKLRPVHYQQPRESMYELPRGRRHDAFVRLARRREAQGLPWPKLPEHDCAIHPCPGTAEHPCGRRIDYDRGYLGLVAEEVEEVFPEAVAHDADGKPNGVNYAAIAILLLQALRETEDRVRVLEAKLSEGVA